MECTTIIAGMTEQKDSWASADLLRYLLLIAGLDAVSGLYTTIVVERCETLTLPRSGWSYWYHRAILYSSVALCAILLAISWITCLISKNCDMTILLSSGILALHMVMLTNLMMLISLVFQNVTLGYLLCMLVQLLSIFCSEQMPSLGKFLLIGNWGMMVRSTLIDPEGIPLAYAIGLEVLILILMWNLGWRIIRRVRRGA